MAELIEMGKCSICDETMSRTKIAVSGESLRWRYAESIVATGMDTVAHARCFGLNGLTTKNDEWPEAIE